MKLLSSQPTFCVRRAATHQFTASLHFNTEPMTDKCPGLCSARWHDCRLFSRKSCFISFREIPSLCWGPTVPKVRMRPGLRSAPIIGGSCHKHNFCRNKSMLVMTKLLLRQNFCHDKYLLQQRFCRDKLTSVVPNMCWSCQNTSFVATKVYLS